MTPTNSNTTAHLAAFLTILCWGTTFVSTKVLLQGFKPVQILLIRFCIGFACKIHPFSRWRTNFPREPLLKRGRGIKNADLWQSID